MKRTLAALLALLLLAAALSACSRDEGNTLFDTVRAEGNSIHFYIYDGKTSRISWVIGESRDRLLTMLKSVSAKPDKNWTPDDITLPIYGFMSTREDGTQFQIAFSNGRAITQDGTAYHMKLDFGAIKRNYAWDEMWIELSDAALIPCGRLLLLNDTTWRTDLMLPAPAPNPPADITATLDSWDGSKAVVSFHNAGTSDWTFGTPFRVDVCVDGVWYAIPERMSDYPMAFTSIGYVVQPGKPWTETYAVDLYYGDLPAGKYRIVAYDLTAEFEVK